MEEDTERAGGSGLRDGEVRRAPSKNPIAPHGQTGRGSLLRGWEMGAGERERSTMAAMPRLNLVWVLLALL